MRRRNLPRFCLLLLAALLLAACARPIDVRIRGQSVTSVGVGGR